jgi:hypothetical protein
MSNRVNVNINANDFSRRGLDSLRRSINRAQRDARRAGGTIRFNVRVDEGASRRDMRRLQRSLRGQPVTITTRLDPPTPSPQTLRRRIASRLGRAVTLPVRLTSRGLVAGVRGPLRSLGGLVSGTLQDGVGQGIIQGFKAGGPVGIAVLAALLLGLASLIGAALSGLLITALGAAFVGVGGISAAMSEEVKAKWSDTLGTLKKLFADVGKPMIPVLETALDRLESMAEKAAPAFKRAMEDSAGATDVFIQKIMQGFESFGKAAFKPIMDAWNVFAPVFGEVWDEFMRELGESFADMANLVKEHPTEIAAALEIVFETLELIVDTVTFFGKMWVFAMQTVGDAVGVVIQIVGGMADMMLGFFDMMLQGAARAFGWIPGLGGKLKDAANWFSEFRDGVNEKLTGMANKAFGWDDALNKANRKRKLEADITSWQHKLSQARADLKKTSSQKARAKLQADITDLNNKISSARAKLNALNGKTATTYVRTVQYGIGAEAANAARRATGGVVSSVGTAATGGVRNNMTLVGERGPELVNLPGGSHVRSNSDTRRIMNRGGRGGGSATLMIDAAGDDTSQFLLRILRHAIRNEGGDVQVVLGRG